MKHFFMSDALLEKLETKEKIRINEREHMKFTSIFHEANESIFECQRKDMK